MTRLKQGLAIAGTAVLCPCHLPLWVGLLAGTSLGGTISRNYIAIFIAMAAGFALALVYLFRFRNVLNPSEEDDYERDRLEPSTRPRPTQERSGSE